MKKPSDRFGIRLAGINLLLPHGQPAEYLADIAVYPIPLMPRRVRGAAQVGGRPVLVFAADEQAPERMPQIARKSIVMLAERGTALAIQVEAPPVALESIVPASQPRPAICIEPALLAPFQGHDGAADSLADNDPIWWEVDCVAMFELLARDGRDPAGGTAPAAGV